MPGEPVLFRPSFKVTSWVFAQDLILNDRNQNGESSTFAQLRNKKKEKHPMEGYIKSYSEKKGYGFIHTEEYGDVFVHKSGIKEFGHFGLQKGDRVSFELKETAKGKQAVNLQPLRSY